MEFSFEVTDQVTYQSETIVNSDGDLGMQIHFVAGFLGDDDNRARLSVIAISGTNEATAQIYFSVADIPPNDTTLIMIHPGIDPLDDVNSKAISAVLPYKFQITVSNVMGLPATFQLYAATLP